MCCKCVLGQRGACAQLSSALQAESARDLYVSAYLAASPSFDLPGAHLPPALALRANGLPPATGTKPLPACLSPGRQDVPSLCVATIR